jgi:hypothetical protein
LYKPRSIMALPAIGSTIPLQITQPRKNALNIAKCLSTDVVNIPYIGHELLSYILTRRKVIL